MFVRCDLFRMFAKKEVSRHPHPQGIARDLYTREQTTHPMSEPSVSRVYSFKTGDFSE